MEYPDVIVERIIMGLFQWFKDVKAALEDDDIWDVLDEEDGPDEDLTFQR